MTRSRLAALPLAAAICLLPWAAYLATSLPDTHTAVHWKLAWTGLDLALAGSFAATAWATRRRPDLLAPILFASATLMTCDSWFDVTTALGTGDQAVALLEAVFELSLALISGFVGVRLASQRPAGGPARGASEVAPARDLAFRSIVGPRRRSEYSARVTSAPQERAGGDAGG